MKRISGAASQQGSGEQKGSPGHCARPGSDDRRLLRIGSRAVDAHILQADTAFPCKSPDAKRHRLKRRWGEDKACDRCFWGGCAQVPSRWIAACKPNVMERRPAVAP